MYNELAIFPASLLIHYISELSWLVKFQGLIVDGGTSLVFDILNCTSQIRRDQLPYSGHGGILLYILCKYSLKIRVCSLADH